MSQLSGYSMHWLMMYVGWRSSSISVAFLHPSQHWTYMRVMMVSYFVMPQARATTLGHTPSLCIDIRGRPITWPTGLMSTQVTDRHGYLTLLFVCQVVVSFCQIHTKANVAFINWRVSVRWEQRGCNGTYWHNSEIAKKFLCLFYASCLDSTVLECMDAEHSNTDPNTRLHTITFHYIKLVNLWLLSPVSPFLSIEYSCAPLRGSPFLVILYPFGWQLEQNEHTIGSVWITEG